MVENSDQNSSPTQQSPNLGRWWFENDLGRQARTLFLNDWAVMVQPEFDRAREMITHAVTFSSSALQAAYLLNGGALAALPALAPGLTTAPLKDLLFTAIMFIGGIASAAISSLCAYFNYGFQAWSSFNDAHSSANAIKKYYGWNQGFSEVSDRAKFTKCINLTLFIGVLFGIASLLLFVVGAVSFLILVSGLPKL